MRRLLPAALLLAALAAAGCAGSTPASSPAPAPAAAPAAAAPELTPAEREFVDRIAREVDPVFAEHPDRYAGRGANSCDKLDDVDQAVERFSGGTITVTAAQAEEILAAARDTVCAE